MTTPPSFSTCAFVCQSIRDRPFKFFLVGLPSRYSLRNGRSWLPFHSSDLRSCTRQGPEQFLPSSLNTSQSQWELKQKKKRTMRELQETHPSLQRSWTWQFSPPCKFLWQLSIPMTGRGRRRISMERIFQSREVQIHLMIWSLTNFASRNICSWYLNPAWCTNWWRSPFLGLRHDCFGWKSW